MAKILENVAGTLENLAGANKLTHFTLNTGAKIPSVAIGTWQVAPADAGPEVEAAIRAGYRHIDCGAIYGNQKEIGIAVKKLIVEGVVKREELFIESKLWHADQLPPERVAEATDETLQALQIDYLDLWIIHWPIRLKPGTAGGFSGEDLVMPDFPTTWKALEAVYRSGKVRAIGVSNFSTKKLSDLMKTASITPAVNQVEAHIVWQQPKLRKFCEAHRVHITAWAPLGSPGTAWIAAEGTVLNQPILQEVAKKLGKTPAQVAIRWCLQTGYSALPKSIHPDWIKENFDVFDWHIPSHLMHEFSKVEQNRLAKGAFCLDPTHGPYRTYDDLWDEDGY